MANELVNTQAEMIVTQPDKTPTMLDYRADRKYKRLYEYQPMVAKDLMLKLVMIAFQYRGQQIKEDDAQYIASCLVDELLNDEDRIGTRCLTFEEITRVIKRAVLGQGRELYGINVASLYAQLADYCKKEGHDLEVQAAKQKAISEFKRSAVAPMLQAYAGIFAKEHKV